MRQYGQKIVEALLDQYERSKSFLGTNRNNQSFTKKIDDMFPKYSDEAQYAIFKDINEQIAELEMAGLVSSKHKKKGSIVSDVIVSVTLNIERIEECYRLLGRTPKSELNDSIIIFLKEYEHKSSILEKYCPEQMSRLAENKKVEHFDSLESFEQILKVLAVIESVPEETFIRNFSIRVLGDSKAFEKIKTKVVSILFKYGDYPDQEKILDDLNVVKNPGYVYIKGNGSVTISCQCIDFSKLDGDFGISSKVLDDVESICVNASRVITIENLTTFNTFEAEDAFIIYLGGYHNSIRRKFITKMYEMNPEKEYYHYGDIDAGGFYILLDLRKKTGIPFKPMRMDVEMLKQYSEYTKRLTENDRSRLANLKDTEFAEVVEYMLQNDCKLEQEAIEA